MTFKELGIIAPLLKALEKEHFTHPTEVQQAVIPYALSNEDILASAQTGSGKTLAFALPILQNLYTRRLARNLPDGAVKRKIEALIIAPTRELAGQIGDSIKDFCTNTNMKSTVIFGGVNDFHQIKAIEKGVDILVATPGRLEDLISQGVIKLSYVEILVLDEADRMLDLGFSGDIKKIMKRVPDTRQTLFFSATLPKATRELAEELLRNPKKIHIQPKAPTVSKVEQKVYHIKASHRHKLIQQLVRRKDLNSIIIFVRARDDIEYVERFVRQAGVLCDSISKDKSQNARKTALAALKNGDIKVLIATDIASRGLDVEGLACVINYNIPSEPENYVHRIGRTARAGKSGLAISLCIEQETDHLKNIEKHIGQTIKVITDDSYHEQIVKTTSNYAKKSKEKKFRKDKTKTQLKKEGSYGKIYIRAERKKPR